MFPDKYALYPHKLFRPEPCMGAAARDAFDRAQLDTAVDDLMRHVQRYSAMKSALTVEQKEELLPHLETLAKCGWPSTYGRAIIEARDYDTKSLEDADAAFKSIDAFSREHGLDHLHAMHIALHYIGEILEKAAKAGFDPNQPRVPRGHARGGEWTGGGGGGEHVTLPRRKPKPLSDKIPLPRRKPPAISKPHPHADSPYYDPETGIYDPPIEPTWSPLDIVGAPAKPVAGAIGSGARAAYNAIRLRRYLSEARQIPKGVREVGKGTENLTTGQKRSLKKFKGKGKEFKNPEVINYSDGSALYSSKIPATNIPKSYALYEKHVDASGKMIRTNKIAIGPNGELIHIKPK